jgi:hypothetical protein
VSLRSSLGSGCARTASPRAARLLHVPVRWAAQDGGCRKKAQYMIGEEGACVGHVMVVLTNI